MADGPLILWKVAALEMVMFPKNENLQRMKDHSLGFHSLLSYQIIINLREVVWGAGTCKPEKFRLGNANAIRSVGINSGHCPILHSRPIHRCADDYFASMPLEIFNEYKFDIFSRFYFLVYSCSSWHQALYLGLQS